MKYVLLIYGPQDMRTTPGTDEWNRLMDGYVAFNAEVDRRGVHLASQALEWTNHASTIRVRDDEPIVTDGPFAETKEILAGFYMIDVESRAEAEELAAMIPGAAIGSVEVRPVMELGI